MSQAALQKRRELEFRAAAALELRMRRAGSAANDAFYTMYDWQREFVAATKTHIECCLMAANQIGKTFTGTTIDAMHLLGDYPDDWDGLRFNHAPLCWGLGYSMEKTRDLLQTALFGKFINGAFQGGIIPASRILGHESAQGTVNAMRTVYVKHKSGDTSAMQFWSYSQGQHAMMGDVVDWVHVDEEPKDQNIRPQLLTRLLNGNQGHGGHAIYTFTPENGRTELVIQFMDSATPDQFFMNKGWDHAPHITPEKRARMLKLYPEHQRDMRSKGVPKLGQGLIYQFSEEFLLIDPIPIEDHWFVINGMDFGWDHPQAHVQLVEDRDNDMFYVTHSWKQRKTSANDAWGAVKKWAEGIPTAWPHDGLQHEKGRDDGKQQRDHYINAGFDMLPDRAAWPSGSISVESGIYEINDLMSKGKWKVFRGQADYMAEHSQYHRDDKGKIVKTMDDILDAARAAYMMRRHAERVGDIGQPVPEKNTVGWG